MDFAIAQHPCEWGVKYSQPIQGLLRPVFLDDTDHGADGGEAEQGILPLPQEEQQEEARADDCVEEREDVMEHTRRMGPPGMPRLGPKPRSAAGFRGVWCGGCAVGGGVAVGVGWVYCFLSRREGDQRKCWEPEAANPLNFKTGSGRRFVRSGFGWGGSGGLWVAETLICKVFRTRVSLKSCSGAILDRDGCGGAGCVCCLRTQ